MHLSEEQRRRYDAAPWQEIPKEPCPWARYRIAQGSDVLVVIVDGNHRIAWTRLALITRPAERAIAYVRASFLKRGRLGAIGLVPNGQDALREHRALVLASAVDGPVSLGVTLAYAGRTREAHLVRPYDGPLAADTH